ncbi:Uncharacterized protein Rs2_42327 [Raphanus sativus]|nr:Uncharacterized protein Rs2_42327 [Raphanus sativus]
MESPGVKTRGVERGWFRRRLVCFRDPMKRVFSLMLFRRCCGGDGQVEAVVLCVALTEQSFPRFEPPWFVLRPDRTEMERGGGRASLGARVFRETHVHLDTSITGEFFRDMVHDDLFKLAIFIEEIAMNHVTIANLTVANLTVAFTHKTR